MLSHFPLNSVCSEVKEDEDEKDEDEEEEDGENQVTPCIRILIVILNNQGLLFLASWYVYRYGCLFVEKLLVIPSIILDLCFYITDHCSSPVWLLDVLERSSFFLPSRKPSKWEEGYISRILNK